MCCGKKGGARGKRSSKITNAQRKKAKPIKVQAVKNEQRPEDKQ